MPDEPAPLPLVPAATPAERLWRRYRQSRGGRIGLALVGAFAMVAFLAPFLAHRFPFFWYDAEGELSYPLIREFFAPSDTTEPMLEKGINFLFLFIPAALLAWYAMNRWFPDLARAQSRFISLLFGAMAATTLWLSIGGMVVQGGGKDWLHYENPPVPEIDDLADVEVFWRRVGGGIDYFENANTRHFVELESYLGEKWEEYRHPAGQLTTPRAEATWKIVRPRLGALMVEKKWAAPYGADEAPRAITSYLQQLIEGPPLAGLSELPPDEADDQLGLTTESLGQRLNTARWNRHIVETAFPGLLTPMRQFRSTFLSLVVASALVLLGLTYIFLAGAWQFPLSPRWLVLLMLAAVVALPFRLPARHDHTPYRQLASEGNGSGLFPVIPYGPNEQGFGPRLPPSWFTESPRLTRESVHSWDTLRTRLTALPCTDGERRLVELFAVEYPVNHMDSRKEEEPRDDLLVALNRLITGPQLYQPDTMPELSGDLSLSPYIAEVRAGRELSPLHRERMNRLILEKWLSGSLNPAAAVRWKKPRHTEGFHLLGTDESGRDVLVRVIHGARVSLSVGFVSIFLATVIGLVLGSLAAYYGGRVDMLISRFIEIMMCFPSFFLILAVIAVLDRRSIVNIMIVIGITSWTGVARLIRGEMLRQKKMDYVSASIALGASDTRTIFRQILPNAMAPVLVSISFGITGAILTEASLSFIGFGVTPPTPTWGQLLSETRDSPLANWWLAVFPGIVLFLSVIAYNMVGEALRDALDPRANP